MAGSKETSETEIEVTKENDIILPAFFLETICNTNEMKGFT
jgi:hypothetical protein